MAITKKPRAEYVMTLKEPRRIDDDWQGRVKLEDGVFLIVETLNKDDVEPKMKGALLDYFCGGTTDSIRLRIVFDSAKPRY